MQVTRLLTRTAASLGLLVALIGAPHGAQAQNPFAPVIEVNEDIITGYDISQRQAFLRVIAPANSGIQATREQLIEEKLQQQALRQVGLEPTEEGIQAGMEEFAERADLTAQEFINILGSRGVAPETFREFVSVGIAWRELIRARFGSRVSIGEEEIDRALAAQSTGSGVRVLLSEIIIPAPPERLREVQARAEEIAQVKSPAQFSSLAREVSAAPSRDAGGRLGWTPITNLPPPLRPQILALGINEVTQPISLPNAVALFQLRGIEEVDAPSPDYSAIEYAQYFIPGGRSDAALASATRLRNRVDVCDDLYGVAKGQPEEVLVRQIQAPGEIPRDIALELAKLDRGEVSTMLTTADGTALIFLMMCGRTTIQPEEINRDAVAAQLRQERLAGYAESFLEQLRADARIREP